MPQGSRLELLTSQLHGPSGVPAIAIATNMFVLVDQIAGSCQFPLQSFDDLATQRGTAGATIILKGRRIALALLKPFVPDGFFPLQSEDDLMQKLVSHFNANYEEPTPAAVASATVFPLAPIPPSIVKEMAAQLSGKLSYPILSFQQIFAALGWRSNPKLATQPALGTHEYNGYSWNIEAVAKATPPSYFPVKSEQDLLAKILDLQRQSPPVTPPQAAKGKG